MYLVELRSKYCLVNFRNRLVMLVFQSKILCCGVGSHIVMHPHSAYVLKENSLATSVPSGSALHWLVWRDLRRRKTQGFSCCYLGMTNIIISDNHLIFSVAQANANFTLICHNEWKYVFGETPEFNIRTHLEDVESSDTLVWATHQAWASVLKI